MHTPPTHSVMIWIKYILQHPNFLPKQQETVTDRKKIQKKKLFKVFLIEPYEGFQVTFFFKFWHR